ncbi:hypothetical protein HYW32_00145 [Candidatus Berkelbacteria bacterium]|nr:hypothetical protein [Candidatus Berkelbacteria bacterium]
MKRQSIISGFIFGLLLGVLGLRLYLLFWGYFQYEFIVPPGGDPAVHLQFINAIQRGTFQIGAYPPAFHFIVAWLAQALALPTVTILILVGPFLVVLPALAVFLLARAWFDRVTALLAAALIGLTGASPILAYMDGNYPNLIAGGFFLILGITALVLGLRKQPVFYSTLASLSFLAVALFHHLTYGLLLAILVVYFLALWILKWFKIGSVPYLRTVSWIVLPSLLLTVAVALLLAGPEVILPALRDLLGGQPPSIFDSALRTPIRLGQYNEIVGPVVVVSGILGIIFLIQRRDLPWERRLFLLLWIGIVFALSRTQFSGLPARFARELGIPLALSGGLLGTSLMKLSTDRSHQLASGAILALFLVSQTVMLTTGPAQLPESFSRLIWFDKSDQEKLAYLEDLPVGSRILATPSSPYYEALLPEYKFSALAAMDLTNERKTGQLIQSRADYLFVDTLPATNPDPIAYPYFANYDRARVALENYSGARIIKTFADGSVVKRVIATLPAVQ